MEKDTSTEYRAVAWADPLTGRVNLAMARTVDDGEHQLADGWDCLSRAAEYATPPDDDAPEPSRPTASLAPREARAVYDALGALLGGADHHLPGLLAEVFGSAQGGGA